MATAKSDPNASAQTTLEEQPGETPNDVKSLLKQLGLKPSSTMQEFAQAVSQHGGLTANEAQGGSPLSEFLAQDPLAHAAEGIGKEIGTAFGAGGAPTEPATQAAPKLPAPKAAAGKTATQQSPYEELANSLASMYLNQVNQLEPLISGQGIFGPNGQTAQAVGAASAMAPGAAGWLGQQEAAENTASKPLQAAMGQVGNAEAAGALGVAPAIANTGTANTEYLQSAPFQQLLNELTSQGAYRLAQSGASALPSNALTTSPIAKYLFEQAGLGSAGTNGLNVGGATKAATGGTTGTTGATTGGGNPSGPSG